MFSASDIGWVVAISYATWCPLFLGCASVIFEGKRECTFIYSVLSTSRGSSRRLIY